MTVGIRRPAAAVTGAAGGLGASFARKLAHQGYDLLLIDRREEPLETLRNELSVEGDATIWTCAANLVDEEAVASVAARLVDMHNLELLVNTAGVGSLAYFNDVDLERHLELIRLHVLAPMRLTRTALPGMLERNRGAIINVSSLAAWLPCAGNVQYAATKIYLITFSESLQEELRDTKILVQALCPGFTRTGFHDTDFMKGFDRHQIPTWLWMSPDDVVDFSLKSLSRKCVIVIPGWRNRLLGLALRMPMLRPLVRAVMRRTAVKVKT